MNVYLLIALWVGFFIVLPVWYGRNNMKGPR